MQLTGRMFVVNYSGQSNKSAQLLNSCKLWLCALACGNCSGSMKTGPKENWSEVINALPRHADS